jgi:membrane-associated protease RseP (regulator of RpoE activity)
VVEILWYIFGIVFIALGIAASIGLHEIGHLVPAKLFGVKVTKYMIGFGPTIFSRIRGETEYGLKAIPLGGYIAMIGMYPPAKLGKKKPKGFFGDMINQAREAHSGSETPADANRKFYQLPVSKRIIIMLGGPFMNLLLGVLLTLVSLSGFGVYQTSLKIASVSECLDSSLKICSDDAKSPAFNAGIQDGDEVVTVGGNKVSDWNEIRQLFVAQPTQSLEVLRQGNLQSVQLTAVLQERPQFDDFGNYLRDSAGEIIYKSQPFLGVFLESERKPLSVSQSLNASGSTLWQIGELILQLPQKLGLIAASTFGSEERDPNGPISIVGIGQIAGEVASSQSAGWEDKLATGIQILGSLNFALFAFNMLPLLPLDGGHVAGGVYEWVKKLGYRLSGKPNPGPADTALLMPLTWLVFIGLLLMSGLLIIADLVNPVQLFG